jgi:hypothetical protein
VTTSQTAAELWTLLGELPWKHEPSPAKTIWIEQHDGYSLERLVLDLNRVEKVPPSCSSRRTVL